MKKTLCLFGLLSVLAVRGGVPAAAQNVPAVPAVVLDTAAVYKNAANPGVVETDSPDKYSAVYVISDVHGMYANLLALLRANGLVDAKNAWTGGGALFVVLGDSINKGADSVDVIDLWRSLGPQLEAAGGKLVVLLGNHEAEFLADPSGSKFKPLLVELNSKKIPLEQFRDQAYPRGAFLRSLPLAFRAGRWLFVHSGLYPAMAWADFKQQALSALQAGDYGGDFLAGADSALEAKNWWSDAGIRASLEKTAADNGLFGIVFGHMPGAFNVEGADASIDGGRLIKIDNGMAPESGAHPGHILEFPEPGKMLLNSYPAVNTLSAAGEREPLVPFSLAKTAAAPAEAD